MYDFNEAYSEIKMFIEGFGSKSLPDIEFIIDDIVSASKIFTVDYFNVSFEITKKINYMCASKDGDNIWIYGYSDRPLLFTKDDIDMWYHDGYQKKLLEVSPDTSLYDILKALPAEKTLKKVIEGETW